MEDIDKKLSAIKSWLGSGSINIFGLPMSGKDSVGVRFAEAIGARFLSSGMIIRAEEKRTGNNISGTGLLVPTNFFYDLVLPYFYREDLQGFPLILSSIGRWSGEEKEVMRAASESGHPTKCAVLLDVSEEDVHDRWESTSFLHDRGDRADDLDERVFFRRIDEFKKKTMPVIDFYRDAGLLVTVRADMTRDEVFYEFVNKIYEYMI